MRYLFVLIVWCIECCFVYGQADNQQPRFNFIGVKDGLPEGTVKTLLQDKYGYIWIGTQTGIVRFDGYNTKVYTTHTRDSVPVYSVSLYEDRRGRLWMGTIDDGIYLYDRGADSFINYVLPFQQNNTKSIFSVFAFQDDAAGNLWLHTYNAQTNTSILVYFNITAKKYTAYSEKEKGNYHINARLFTDFLEDKNGSLWVGSENGIYHYDSKSNSFKAHFSNTDSLKRMAYWHLMQDEQDPEYIYCGSWYSATPDNNAGLFRFNINTYEHTAFVHDANNKKSLFSNEVWKIKQVDKNLLVLGTGDGLSFFNTITQTFDNYRIDDKEGYNIYDKIIKDIVEDNKGNYWCETNKGILYFNIHTKKFTRYTNSSKTENGIAGNYIHNLMCDKTGNIWFGADQAGLQWLDVSKSKFVTYRNNPNLLNYFPGGNLNSIAESKDGSFWMGSAKGLYHWQPQQNTFSLVLEDKLKDATVVSVITDREGLVWFRAFGNNVQGVYVYNPITKAVKNYRHNDKDSTSLVSDNIQHIAEDSAGNIWLGSGGKGISRINKTTRQIANYPFIANNGINTDIAIKNGWLDDDEVQSIYTDKAGRVFVGTNNGSINMYDAANDKFIPANKELFKGLYCVTSIFNDTKNRLWAGTYMTGIFVKNGERYNRFSNANSLLYNGSWGMNEDKHGNIWSLSPRGLTIIKPDNSTRNITAVNGLPEEPGYFALFKSTNGNFIYGFKNGFVQFDPDDFLPDTIKPVLHIESISFAKPSGYDSVIIAFNKHEIKLHYNENRITFYYTGLRFQNTATIQYAYRLQGYDNNWREAGTDRSVTYTNLSPGTYFFHIKAANSDGMWTDTDETVTIIILPPWWETWWFRILSVIAMVAVVYAIVQRHLRNLKKQNLQLEEKVIDRTKELKQSLEHLKSTQSQLIHSEKMASLGELTAGIAHEIQNPLNFVNNFSEVNKELIIELVDEVSKGNTEEVIAIANDIKTNSEKINVHGKRADAIVKGMLQHSRKSEGKKEPTDINALCDEYVRLAYHGLRAKDKSFNADFKTDFDETIGKINIVPQDIGRVLLNLINNAFYAVKPPNPLKGEQYKPLVSVETKKINNKVEIKVIDNGNGIPASIKEKIFQPFFTTKPTGQGTGLGLSLSYDIIKAHGGEIKVENHEGAETTFIIQLPIS